MTNPILYNSSNRNPYSQRHQTSRHRPAMNSLNRRMEKTFSQQPSPTHPARVDVKLIVERLLTKKIKETTTPDQLQKLIEQNAKFNHFHISAAVKKVFSFEHIVGDIYTPLLSKLDEMLKDDGVYFSHNSLCTISYALIKNAKDNRIKLTQKEISILRLISAKLIAKFEYAPIIFNEQNLSNLADAFSKMLTGKEKLNILSEEELRIFFEHLSKEIKERNLKNFGSQALSIIALSFTRLEKDFGVLKKVADEIKTRGKEELQPLKSFEAEALLMLAKAFSVAKKNYGILDYIAYEISNRGLHNFTSTQLSTLAFIFRKTKGNVYEILDKIKFEVCEPAELKKIKPEELSRYALTFANIKEDHPVLECLLSEINRRKEDLSEFSIESLSKICMALTLESVFCSRIFSTINDFQLFDLIEEIIKERVNPENITKVSTKALTNLVYSLTKEGKKDCKIFSDELCRRLSDNKFLKNLNSNEIVGLAAAFSSLENNTEIFNQIAKEIEERKKTSKLSYFKNRDLERLLYSFLMSKNDLGMFSNISCEIQRRMDDPSHYDFAFEELSNLALQFTIISESELAIKLIELFFSKNPNYNTFGINQIFFAIVNLIVNGKIERIPDEWLEILSQRKHSPIISSELENSVGESLKNLGIFDEFTSNKIIYFKIGGRSLRFCEVDFFNEAKKLVIEVDGPSHDSGKLLDPIKAGVLKTLGCRVIRINFKDWDNKSLSARNRYLGEKLNTKPEKVDGWLPNSSI